jgi:hypothetical protein
MGNCTVSYLLQADDVCIVRVQLGKDARLAVAPCQPLIVAVAVQPRGDVFLSKDVVAYKNQLRVTPPADGKQPC